MTAYILNMEPTNPSETVVTTQSTHSHISEDLKLHQHQLENLKSSYRNSATNLENGDFMSIKKREEQTQVLEMLDKDYISVNICVILLTKFNSYLCVYMGLYLKCVQAYVRLCKYLFISQTLVQHVHRQCLVFISLRCIQEPTLFFCWF